MLRGPVKMLQTVAMITKGSKADATAERFKALISRTKWVEQEALDEALANEGAVDGLKGLSERVEQYDLETGFVAVVAAELPSGELECAQLSGVSYLKVDDDGSPWLYVLDHGQSRTATRPGYSYATLRPYRVGPQRHVPAHIPKPDYALNGGDPLKERTSEARSTPPVLTAAQIKGTRAAAKLGRECLDAAHRIVRPGVTTDEIDRLVHDITIEAGAYPAPLNYHNFPKSLCTSVNEVVCHGIPDLRELEDGDIVNVDISPILNGYHGDLNETFCVGKGVSTEKKNLIKATHDSLMKAIGECKPGTFYRDLGNTITKHINGCGFQVDKTYCGHGIGEFFHCAPNIPHYANNKAKFVMKQGHCFTIEPMVNAGTWKDTHWPDGWTAVTKDCKPSAQFEHQLLCNAAGVEILTARLKSSPPLWWEEGGGAIGAPTI